MIPLGDLTGVAATLRTLREAGGYTPTDVASLVVLDVRLVERIEAGVLPSLAELTLIVMVYGYDVTLTPREEHLTCKCEALPWKPHAHSYACAVLEDRERA